ncbi:hypothetical protein D8674_010186 [Pyrus ussuriensis x Pyrus communis]|uniref:Uncharacterized protein n=1 Tax=Pyrus ussuriensis x Pyrus communis TaxID=2448454 RepID=A0A5N5FA25_9ROSA|nr:hypothetical protein D8674_010186 [Pyrus ussuriensis x Pyrus communis]
MKFSWPLKAAKKQCSPPNVWLKLKRKAVSGMKYVITEIIVLGLAMNCERVFDEKAKGQLYIILPSSVEALSSSDITARGTHSPLVNKHVCNYEVLPFNASGLHSVNHARALIRLTISPTNFEEVIVDSNHLVRNYYQGRYAVNIRDDIIDFSTGQAAEMEAAKEATREEIALVDPEAPREGRGLVASII